MALWLDDHSAGNQSYLPPVKYDARSGLMYRRDRGLSGWEDVEITSSFKAIFDFESVEIGWAKLGAGKPPSWVLMPWRPNVYLSDFPPRPDAEHKSAFRLTLKLSKDCGGDVREFGGTSQALRLGFDVVHDQYLAEAASNPGKLPVIIREKTELVVTKNPKGSATNHKPIFKIVSWVPRPADLIAKQAPEPAPAQTTRAAPPATGAVRAAPPPPPPPVVDDEDDFG